MIKSLKKKIYLFLSVLLLIGSFAGVAAAENSLQRANDLLSAWRLGEARVAIDEAKAEFGEGPIARYLEARYAFFAGQYDKALEEIDAALAYEEHNDWLVLRELIKASKEVTADYQSFKSPSGRFEILMEPGRDEVLLPYAFEALEKAYEVFGQEIGYYPADPIRVEIYPKALVLADVSTLTQDDIRTSGTIALAQYNRLMITSPRGVLRGYTWVDTLVHEYIHYIVNQRAPQRVPIWMHEGLAKYMERLWRGPDAAMMEVASEFLLRKRLDEGTLIPFEAMHPSMAKLPSQEDAAVAFAEVYTTMEYLREKVGPGAFAKLLDEVNAGYDAQTAYARVLDTSWERFEEHDWPNYLHQRPKPEIDDEANIFESEIVLEDQAAAAGNDLQKVEVPQARDHIQLGQMLQAHNRFGAAVVQYEKAAQLVGEKNLVLQTRLAQSQLESGAPAKAVEALQPVRELYPGNLSIWISLGKAYLAMDEFEEAREALREAARINPFNPEVHHYLARACRALGLMDEAEEADRALRLVSGR